MRLLFTIPHFFGRVPEEESTGRHGAHGKPRIRLESLSACLIALHQLYGKAQCVMQLAERTTVAANQPTNAEVHVVICTTGGQHLLDHVSLEPSLFQHCPTDAEPKMLGFQCHGVLRDRWGNYDYYGYLEDDLILHDPWLFAKLAWFNAHAGQDKVLLPNRFERGPGPLVHRAYVDGDVKRQATARFQDIDDTPRLESQVMGRPLVFRRPLNPHSGCFFLNSEQLQHWTRQSFFMDQDTSFIGPLESAATLSIMRAFKIYKAAPENANFLEIEHSGSQFLRQIRRPGEK